MLQEPVTHSKAAFPPPPISGALTTPRAPAKTKQAVDITGIFDQVATLKRKRAECGYDDCRIEEPSVLQLRAARPGYFKKSAKTGVDRTTLLANSLGHGKYKLADEDSEDKGAAATAAPVTYSQALARYAAECATLEAEHSRLFARSLSLRQRGLDDHGRPFGRPPVPTQADISKLRARRTALDADVRDERIKVVTACGEMHGVRLGDTLELFRRRVARKQTKAAQIEAALDAIAAEVRKIAEGADEDEVDAEYEAQVEELEQEKERAGRKAEKERAALKVEERAARNEFKKGLQVLVEAQKF